MVNMTSDVLTDNGLPVEAQPWARTVERFMRDEETHRQQLATNSKAAIVASGNAVTAAANSVQTQLAAQYEANRLPATLETSEITVTPSTYFDASGTPWGRLDVSVTSGELDVDGNPLVPVAYQAWVRVYFPAPPEVDEVDEGEDDPPPDYGPPYLMLGSSASADIQIDGLQVGTEYQIQLAAISPSGVSSEFSDYVTATTPNTLAVMTTPDAPVLTTGSGMLVVTWDGHFDASLPPSQFRYLYAEVSAAGDNDWSRMGSSLVRGGGSIQISGLTVGDEYDVRLTAVDSLGVATAASPTTTITIAGTDLGSLDSDVSDAIQRAQAAADAGASAAAAASTAAGTADSKAAQALLDAANAKTDAIAAAATDATTKANAAKTAAEAAAATDAQTKANAALAAAKTDAQTKATTAQNAAIAAAAITAQSKADAAQAAATSAAATTAQSKADAAQAAALAAAKTYADAQASGAGSDALAAAEADATAKANAAKAAAITAAATDATSKAAAAQSAATSAAATDATTKANAAAALANAAQSTANTAKTNAATAQSAAVAAQGTADTAKTNAATAQTAANSAASAASTADGKAVAAQGTANTAVTNAAAANSAAATAAGIANGKGKVVYSTTAPTGADAAATTLWIDTTGGANAPKRWTSGTTWVAVTDKAATDAATAASAAQTQANTATANAAAAQSTANTAKTNAATAQTAATNAATAASTADGKAVAAQGTANTAVTNASAAQTKANSAFTNAATAQTAANAASALAATKASPEYIASRGTDLVTNGTGMLKDNTNFSDTVYDPADAPAGAVGSFTIMSKNAVFTTDERMPVDTSRRYLLRIKARQQVVGEVTNAYTGLAPYDAAGLLISPQCYMWQTGTDTTLAVALKPGDTTVKLTSAANWNNAAGPSSYLRTLIFWDWTDSLGKTWPIHTYSRHTFLNMYEDGGINFSTNTITLEAPWAGPALSAGVSLSNGASGGTYMYGGAANVTIPQTWTEYSAIYSGEMPDTRTVATTSFPPGCAQVEIVFLTNRATSTSRQAFADISFSDATAALQDAAAAQTTANTAIANAATAQAKAVDAYNNAATAQGTANTALSTANGKNKVIFSTSVASGTTGYTTGDIWFQTSGSVIVGQWTFTTSWQARTIDNAVIANLNAGKITAGTLDADRIGAASITAEKMVVGTIDAASAILADAVIDTAQIADLAVGDAQISDLSGDKITARSITADQIGAEEITATEIAAGTITADQIAAGAITANELSPTVGDDLDISANGTVTVIAGQMQDVSDGLDGTNDALDEMQTYYAFGPDGATISTPDSPFQLALRSDRIEMLENGATVSYWNSGQMFVRSLVGEEVVLGNHKLEKYGTGTVVRSL